MKFDEIDKLIGNLSYMTSDNGKSIYDFIIENNIQNILELGCAEGKSTLYMAAALDEIGSGAIITIDLRNPKIYLRELPLIRSALKKASQRSHFYWNRSNSIAMLKLFFQIYLIIGN